MSESTNTTTAAPSSNLTPEKVTAMYGALGAAVRPAFVVDVLSQLDGLTQKQARPVLVALTNVTKDTPEQAAVKKWRSQAKRAAHRAERESQARGAERKEAKKTQWEKDMTPNVLGQALRYVAAFDAAESEPTP